MRKTVTGSGGMGSAETGIFAALAEGGDQRLVVGKHEGLVAAMADGYHRMSGDSGHQAAPCANRREARPWPSAPTRSTSSFTT